MTPDRWVRVKEVLVSVLDRPGEERAAFLDRGVRAPMKGFAGKWRVCWPGSATRGW